MTTKSKGGELRTVLEDICRDDGLMIDAILQAFASELDRIAEEKLPKKKSIANEPLMFREIHQRYGFNEALDQTKAVLKRQAQAWREGV